LNDDSSIVTYNQAVLTTLILCVASAHRMPLRTQCIFNALNNRRFTWPSDVFRTTEF
jgi:hypothetical protein